MKTLKTRLVVLIFASVATFRRAGHGFTDAGSAFHSDHFTDEQRAAINAEPRLSVKEVPFDAIPTGVDTSALDLEQMAIAKADAEAQAQEEAAKETSLAASEKTSLDAEAPKKAAAPKKSIAQKV